MNESSILISRQDCYRNFFLNVIDADFSNTLSYNYSNVVFESKFLIIKNEIRKTIREYKLNNVSNCDNIFNRIFKTFIEKSMLHLVRFFQICATLNYHSRCFREIHMITLKKFEKKDYTNIK